jgi:hypothetical protein
MRNESRKKGSILLKDWSGGTKKYLAILTSLAGFVVSLVGGFVQPVTISDEQRSALLRFTPFLVTIIAGLIFFLAQKWSSGKGANRWFVICAASFVLSVLSLMTYWYFIHDRTCIYDGENRIVGTSYTPKGQSYVSEYPHKTCEELLDDFVGEAEAVWTKESINQSRLILESSYIICICLLAICLLSLGQAVNSIDKTG